MLDNLWTTRETQHDFILMVHRVLWFDGEARTAIFWFPWRDFAGMEVIVASKAQPANTIIYLHGGQEINVTETIDDLLTHLRNVLCESRMGFGGKKE